MARAHQSLWLIFLLTLTALAGCTSKPEVWHTERVLSGIPIHGMHGLAFGPDGGLYIGSVMGQSIIRVDTSTGTIREVIPAPAGEADDVAFSPDGSMAWTALNQRSRPLHCVLRFGHCEARGQARCPAATPRRPRRSRRGQSSRALLGPRSGPARGRPPPLLRRWGGSSRRKPARAQVWARAATPGDRHQAAWPPEDPGVADKPGLLTERRLKGEAPMLAQHA